MSLTAKIDQEIKDAMRARETPRLSALRMLKSSLKYAAIEKGGADNQVTDAEVLVVVRKRIKQCQDAVEGFEKGNRPEQAAKEKAEITLLQTYLPAAIPADELSAIVRQVIEETGASGRAETGAVMKAVMPQVAGRADGKTVNAEVMKQLG
jgi:hypothetical protein